MTLQASEGCHRALCKPSDSHLSSTQRHRSSRYLPSPSWIHPSRVFYRLSSLKAFCQLHEVQAYCNQHCFCLCRSERHPSSISVWGQSLRSVPWWHSSDIMQIRDDLLKKTSEIYKSALPTDHRACKKAQKALKKEEEQYFAPGEVDSMLSEPLRTNPHSQKSR